MAIASKSNASKKTKENTSLRVKHIYMESSTLTLKCYSAIAKEVILTRKATRSYTVFKNDVVATPVKSCFFVFLGREAVCTFTLSLISRTKFIQNANQKFLFANHLDVPTIKIFLR